MPDTYPPAPRPAAEVPPAPAELLAGYEGWGGRRCVCGLPVTFSEIVQALVHFGASPASPPTLAYLNAHPHNVVAAEDGPAPEPEGCIRCGTMTRSRCQSCGNPLCTRCTGYPHDTRPFQAPPDPVTRDTDGTILRGPSLPCGCPLDSGCDGHHPGRLS